MTGAAVVSARPAAAAQSPARRDRANPCTMVICGALGDLSRRKLLPAIYQLMKEHLVADDFAVLGVGRDDSQTDDTFRTYMRRALDESDEVHGVDNELWEDLWNLEAGQDRVYVQGLIQVAAHFVHLKKGNWSGARSVARSAREKFVIPATHRIYRELDLNPVLSALDYNVGLLEDLADQARLQEPPPPPDAFLFPKLFR